jgi:hypothetical protein
VGCAASVEAEEVKPFNLALWNPVQVYDETTVIHGVRLNLFGKNRGVQGLDIGVINATEEGGFKGLQYGIVGLNSGDMVGWQWSGLVSHTGGEAHGLQSGVLNHAGKMVGAQLGFVNVTDSMHGFQLAFVNYTENLRGLQIGLVCIANQVPGHPILPIVNFSF